MFIHPTKFTELLRSLLFASWLTLILATGTNDSFLQYVTTGNIDGVINYLQKGTKICRSTMSRAIHHASQVGDLQMGQLLLDQSSEPFFSRTDSLIELEGYEALIEAIKGRHLEIIELLIDNEVMIMKGFRKSSESTPLYFAAEAGLWDVVKVLIEKGAEVNEIDSNKVTTLMFAAKAGNAEIVQLCIKNGANVNASNLICGSTISLACESGNLEIVRILVQNGASVHEKSLLGKVIQGGNFDILKYLVENGANVNPPVNSSLFSPLISAVKAGNLEMTKFLVENGTNVNAICSTGLTALKKAAEVGNLEIVTFLVEQGAKVSSPIIDSPLHHAIKGGNPDVVRFLLDNGAKMITKENHSTLVYAVKRGNVDVLKVLIEKGAIADSENGRIALECAIEARKEKLVELLNAELAKGISESK